MKCEVLDCNSTNCGRASDISFFRFPSDEALRRKWIKFCNTGRATNLRNGAICMKHFEKSCFENNLKYEMGFSSKRQLKRGSIPTIYKQSAEYSKRLKQIEQQENKKIVETLLREHSMQPISEKLIPYTQDCDGGEIDVQDPLTLIESPIEDFDQESDIISLTDTDSYDAMMEIQKLKQEIEKLKKENLELRKANEEYKKRLKTDNTTNNVKENCFYQITFLN